MNAKRIPELPDGLHRIALADGRTAIAKVRRRAPDGFFEAEARGLAALAASRTLRVPLVHAVQRDGILVEDLGSGRSSRAQIEHAGAALARMHTMRSDVFGFDAEGWCGDSAQDNTQTRDGYAFFAERRLAPQAERARATGLLDANDEHAIDRIVARLADLVPRAAPVLVHGDLWTANLHACANGELALIDAGAVHYSWAETDLAMLTLFGEPPAPFFAAYESEAGIGSDWRERAPVYNLYHLLNHLNLFGESYLGSVRAILRRYG
jgi:fructosamine-3-kinase